MEKYRIRNNIRRLRFDNNEMTQEQLAGEGRCHTADHPRHRECQVFPLAGTGFQDRPGFRCVAGGGVFIYLGRHTRDDDRNPETQGTN